MGHLERRQKEKEHIRNSILDTALHLAVSDGWNAVTIRKIAEEIEYTPPIVYEYFKNKDALLMELALRGHRELYEGYLSAKKNTPDPRKMLLMLALNHWNFAFTHNELYQLMFSIDRPIPHDEMHKFVISIREIFIEITKDEQLAKEHMYNWMCLQQGFIYNVKQKGLPPDLVGPDPKELFERSMKHYISSI